MNSNADSKTTNENTETTEQQALVTQQGGDNEGTGTGTSTGKADPVRHEKSDRVIIP